LKRIHGWRIKNYTNKNKSESCQNCKAVLTISIQLVIYQHKKSKIGYSLKYPVSFSYTISIIFLSKINNLSFRNLFESLLPVKSVTITTYFVSSIPTDGKVYLIQHFVHKFISDLRQVGGFCRTFRFPIYFLILLKVELTP
jgi:hypothetical protein